MQLKIPKFLEEYNSIKSYKAPSFLDPFNKQGVPRVYVMILTPFINPENKRITKKDMLTYAQKFNKDQNEAAGYYSDYFAALSRCQIITFNQKLRRWERGKNFTEFLGYIIAKGLEFGKFQKRIATLFIKTNSNAQDFIINAATDYVE